MSAVALTTTRTIRLVVFSMLALLARHVMAQDARLSAAEAAAGAWLVLLDSNRYAESWGQASPLLRGATTESEWVASLTKYRSSLGAVKKRSLVSVRVVRSVPIAPFGEYVVVQYETEFDSGASAVETIAPREEPEGSWKVSGYYIK